MTRGRESDQRPKARRRILGERLAGAGVTPQNATGFVAGGFCWRIDTGTDDSQNREGREPECFLISPQHVGSMLCNWLTAIGLRIGLRPHFSRNHVARNWSKIEKPLFSRNGP